MAGKEQQYARPEIRVLGSLDELTLGLEGQAFPDQCELAMGSAIGTDPCSGQPGPGGVTKP